MFQRRYCLFLFLLFSPLVIADDAVEASATGNITFETTKDLVMQSEVLKITKLNGKSFSDQPVKIDVDFHIKNLSNQDIVRKVAFVLPPVYCREDKNYSWRGFQPSDAKSNLNDAFYDLQTFINGRPQVVHERREAFKNKKNITNRLNELGIALNPCDMLIQGELDPKYAKILRKKRLLTESGNPIWSLNQFFEWIQTFPAGKTVDIHHIYTTSTGGSVLSPRTAAQLNTIFTDQDASLEPIWNHKLDSLSISHPFIVKTMDHETHFCVIPKWVRYQLTTGAKWYGGIRHFTLIIRDNEGIPFAINQFYHDENVWTHFDNHTAKFVVKNFVPTENILVQFLVLPKSVEAKRCDYA